MNLSKKLNHTVCLLLITVSLSACTSVHKPPSGFLENTSNLKKGIAFKQEFVVQGTDLTQYKRVKVNPVDISHFQNPYEEYSAAEIQTMAGELKDALEKRLSKRYEILALADKPDPSTLVISPALVYATSPEWVINALTFWLIGFQFSKGSAALEAKLIDGQTGKELGAVAERRKGGGGILDIKSLTIGGFFRFIHAEGAFSRWGKNFDKMTSPITKKK